MIKFIKNSLKIAFFLVMLSCSNAFSQAPAITWQKSLGGSNSDFAHSIQQTSDGGYVLAGYTYSTDGDVTSNYGAYDYWVLKLNSVGVLVWQKNFGGSNNDYAHSIQQTTDGGYLVAGYTNSNNGDVIGNHGSSDFWVLKLDATGTLVWQKTLGGSGDDKPYSLQKTSDGGCVIAGYTSSTDGNVTGNHGVSDFWVVKLDTTGNLVWQKTFGGSSIDGSKHIIQTSDGGYVVVGYTYSNNGEVTGNHGDSDFWVIKLNSIGDLVWQKTLGGMGDEKAYNIQQTTDGGYVVVGYTYSTDGDVTSNHGAADYWVVKLSPTGTLIWQKTIGGINSDYAFAVRQTTDDGYAIIGSSNSINGDITSNHGEYDCWLVKLDSIATIIWQKAIGGSEDDAAYDIQLTNDGNYVFCGYNLSNNADVIGNQGEYDCLVVKLATAPLSTEEFKNSKTEFSPNPTHDFITFVEDITTLNIFDITGKKIKSFENTNTIFDVSELVKGIYIIKGTTVNDTEFQDKLVKE